MSIKVSLRIILDQRLAFDPTNNFSENFDIIYMKKGEPVRKNSKTLAKYNIIIFNEIAIFEKDFGEEIIKQKLEIIFEYLEKNNIIGRNELWISLLPEVDQFGIDISTDFLEFLVKNNCYLTLSGIFL